MSSILAPFLRGEYVFDRQVSSPFIRMTGCAFFKERGLYKAYYEEGSYILEGMSYVCAQERRFIVTSNRMRIEKREGNLLHELIFPSFSGFPWSAHHIYSCQKDDYSLTWVFHSWKSFSTFYRVRGPQKKYELETHFRRPAG